MNEKEEYFKNIEKKEGPFSADLRVTFIRHGKPEYTEEEIETGNFEGELSSQTKEEIKNNA
ncbi:hypothetical protein GQ568_03435, partial [Patescibacteria group bacterium]|nr:hypothetical protein [Patescibacteria group bacterium]